MEYVDDLTQRIAVTPDSTVSTTVIRAEGVRLVLFAFDEGEELSEHTAAMPVLLQTISGRLQVSASGDSQELTPGGVIHLDSREPHSVVAAEPSVMLLTMLDSRH